MPHISFLDRIFKDKHTDLASLMCPQHQEAAELHEKLTAKWWSTCQKYAELSLSLTGGPGDSAILSRMQLLNIKINSLAEQVNNLRRGMRKCCMHKDWLDLIQF